jgi:hypothetical protein
MLLFATQVQAPHKLEATTQEWFSTCIKYYNYKNIFMMEGGHNLHFQYTLKLPRRKKLHFQLLTTTPDLQNIQSSNCSGTKLAAPNLQPENLLSIKHPPKTAMQIHIENQHSQEIQVQIEVLEGGINARVELRNAAEGPIFLYTITVQAGAAGSRRAARGASSPGEGGLAAQDSAADAWPVSQVAVLPSLQACDRFVKPPTPR